MLSTLVVTLVLAAPINAWEKASSIPVRATLDPVVFDKTSPMVPTAVEVSGVLGERLRAQTFGRELYSREGNVNGSIADADPATFRVTFDGKPQEEAFFGIAIEKPVMIRRATYAAGNIFHDGGWFDTTGGKPRLQVKKSADGPWVDVAIFEDYPAATATDPKGIRPGVRFTARCEPVQATAIRIIGKPASGDNPAQAFASCAELTAIDDQSY